MASDRLVRRTLAIGALTTSGFAFLGCGGSQPPPDDPAVIDSRDTGGTVEPASEAERQLLAQLGELPAGRPQRIGPLRAVADAPYYAASGRICRSVTVTQDGAKQKGETRLACSEGKDWFFVPSVFVAPTGDP